VMNDHTGPVVETPRWSGLARMEYWTGIGAALISVAIAVGIGHRASAGAVAALAQSFDGVSHPSDILRGAVWAVSVHRRIDSVVSGF
jgi:hypothetical protein